MNEKRKEDEARELTPEEIDDLIFEEQNLRHMLSESL